MSDSPESKTASRPGEPQQWQPPTSGSDAGKPAAAGDAPPREYGGRNGLDPTRYGDWEKNGRCIDF